MIYTYSNMQRRKYLARATSEACPLSSRRGGEGVQDPTLFSASLAATLGTHDDADDAGYRQVDNSEEIEAVSRRGSASEVWDEKRFLISSHAGRRS